MDICICARCEKVFWKDDMSSHRSYCKPCMAEIQREWRSNNRERYLESVRIRRRNRSDEYNENNRNKRFFEPEKTKAVNDLNHAISAGKVVRQPCEVCGAFPAHAHHNDYSKPLDILWLCQDCHNELHGKFKKQVA